MKHPHQLCLWETPPPNGGSSDDAARDNRRALGFVLRNLATTGMAACDAAVQLGGGEDVEIYNEVKPAIDFLFRVAGKLING